VTISVRPKPYIIPEYSLTGDLLAFLTCPLQYRYYNKAALPPSTPVQLWFGEFIHGVLEEAFEAWRDRAEYRRFPWDWRPLIRGIEMHVHERLRAKGPYPPPQLFCPYDRGAAQGLCPNDQHPHQLVATRRAEAAINTWGQHLFPLISEAEVKLKGSRNMPAYREGVSRSNYYSVTGVVDVISSVHLASAPAGNLIIHALEGDNAVAGVIQQLGTTGYDIIIDYKGMRRPASISQLWQHHAWQVQTYCWLRTRQANTQPIAAAILFYINELNPSGEDLRLLKTEVANASTDVMPAGHDIRLINAWRPRQPAPALSQRYRELRSMRIVPIDEHAIQASLEEFDRVVHEIEASVLAETEGAAIRACWQTNPERRTCTACDFKTYCPNPAPGPYPPTVP